MLASRMPQGAQQSFLPFSKVPVMSLTGCQKCLAKGRPRGLWQLPQVFGAFKTNATLQGGC